MRKLEEMTLEEQWELFPIELVKPDPEWRVMAREEIRYLQSLLPIKGFYYHIGSTAIAGIYAKPVVDILLCVDSVALFPVVKEHLVEGGYICMSEAPSRISFNKGYTERGYDKRVFHIHLRVEGDSDEIYFRDYLNANTEVAFEYEALKKDLAEKFRHNRDAYTEGKSAFVAYYTRKAKASLLR